MNYIRPQYFCDGITKVSYDIYTVDWDIMKKIIEFNVRLENFVFKYGLLKKL